MYLPSHFEETDPARIAALIMEYPFGTLITAPGGVPHVSHLPFLYDAHDGAYGRLYGHLARANPQWPQLAEVDEVLVLFQGPHAYVSPGWYASPGVPTWNYAVAQVRGRARLIEDAAALTELLERMTRQHESRLPEPWQPALEGERGAALLRAIVGFSIEITQIQAKFKLSQNRDLEDRRRVIDALNHSHEPMAGAVAALMASAVDDTSQP